MSTFFKSLRVCRVVALVGVVLLSACGGGGDELATGPGVPMEPSSPIGTVPEAPAVVDTRPTADLQQLRSVANRCGVGSYEEFGANAINTGSFIATFDGLSQAVGYLYSVDYYNTEARMDIAIPQTDFRMGSLDPGHPDRKMGIALSGPFLVDSVSCVKGTGRIAVVEGQTGISWFSDVMRPLPVEQLPGIPVAGLEFFGNFLPENPVAYFTLDAGTVSHPEGMEVCQLLATGLWSCQLAISMPDGDRYTFSAPVPGHGVYLLTEMQQ